MNFTTRKEPGSPHEIICHSSLIRDSRGYRPSPRFRGSVTHLLTHNHKITHVVTIATTKSPGLGSLGSGKQPKSKVVQPAFESPPETDGLLVASIQKLEIPGCFWAFGAPGSAPAPLVYKSTFDVVNRRLLEALGCGAIRVALGAKGLTSLTLPLSLPLLEPAGGVLAVCNKYVVSLVGTCLFAHSTTRPRGEVGVKDINREENQTILEFIHRFSPCPTHSSTVTVVAPA
ncbi:hypothetical protein THAOC_14850 [Thalassiosira oceanica]|uniref:Uncharacterized protein n=1 Tax=Thalassiosira oceanica TaxID=159749 RepID=K0T1R0_THAOC|nr:hypothetical protein THAOC_14850 [Thalassiosira oceanica]|eukprot:EJK64412.1 hypothetical protein THAOC_14850 [Thalassiosira oceanica]